MARDDLSERFPALRHAAFRRYILGQSISLIGFWMQNVAQGWLVWRLSGSAFALGVVASVGTLPTALLAPIAGVVADRVDKRRLILATQTGAMLLAATVGTLVALDRATVPAVAVAAACLGIVGAFDLTTRQAFLVDLVGTEDVPAAVALNASIFNAARVVGPAIAGTIVAAVGETPCFFLNALSFLGVIVALAGMPPVRPRHPHAGQGGLRSGLGYVASQPVLRALLIGLGVVSGLALQFNVVMPAIAERVFAAGPRGYGILLTAFGSGAALSALRLASRRQSEAEHRRTLLVGLALFGIGLLATCGAPSFPVALACLALAGFGMVRFTATTNGLLQLRVDDRFRGRVMGLHTVMFLGTAPIGSLVIGAVAQAWGPRAALAVSAATPLAVGLWLAGRLRADPLA